MLDKKIRINENIRSPQVRLIDEKGAQIGIKPIYEALRLASEKDMDLVEIVPNATPPVCKIIDFSKLKYLEERKQREQRKKSKFGQIKEIRFRPRINEHDLEFKIKHAREFIQQKFRVKITISLFGREMQHRELGIDLMEKIKHRLSDISVVESQSKFEGNRLITLFTQK
ncbi:MAG: translation initiation factor IF-3 [Elusimicrobiota bacterium]